ncbi:MAG: amino acid permease [Deltaproteobacteria bacterium]|nr:amino acid permease [Deltaproteobacteria bacterium]
MGIGINGLIGSGIFLLPVRVFAEAGGLSWAAWFVAGGLCLLVALCFAEVASMTTRSGGPYAYAHDAFGEPSGFLVGWMAAASTLIGYAAVARGLGRNLAYIFPVLDGPVAQGALATSVIAGLAGLNIAGARPGANASNFFSFLKLVPLLLFAAVGLFFVHWGALATPPPTGAHTADALRLAALAGLFACTGFEYVPVPAGETQNPQRAVPLALVGTLLGTTALYAIVQIVLIGTHPDLAHADKPLAEAATAFGGPRAGQVLALCAALSSFGFCTGSALVGPRYFASLGEDGVLPRSLAKLHPRTGAPVNAIVLLSVLTIGFAFALDFDRLADISVVAVFVQYVPTCLAVIRLRKKAPDVPRSFRLPLGPVIPLAATAGCLVFLQGTQRGDLILSGYVLLAGLVVYVIQRVRGAT